MSNKILGGKKEDFKMKELLNEEIRSELEELKGVQIGTDEYDIAVAGITKLIDKAIDIDKFDAEQSGLTNMQVQQLVLQKYQCKQESKHKTAQLLITIGTAVLTAAITIWGTRTTLQFEERGTVTTSAGRSFLGRLIPKK